MKTADRIIYVVRHGKPEGEAAEKRCLGITDVPLSEEGRAQAEALGERLAAELAGAEPGGGIRIISSPACRCFETAHIIGRRFPGPVIEAEPDLREIHMGIWDGKYFDEIRDTFPAEYEARGKDLWNYRVPGGESFAEAGARFRSVVEKLTRQTERKEDAVIIVSHAGAVRAGISLLTGVPFEEMMRRRIPYAGITALKCGTDKTGGLIYEIDENGRGGRTGALS
ncbi:MAG: histidine phosphatase family protein [Lachnospiraceae bacterium]|nr:histidine phosphatase family protein [Lachnospiraceae bacterium]